MTSSGFVGFDAERRPVIGCCGVIAYLARVGMEHQAFNWMRRHNSKYHKSQHVPSPIPRRDLGLVDWY